MLRRWRTGSTARLVLIGQALFHESGTGFAVKMLIMRRRPS
jgi:hypothetical protein